MIAVIKVSPRAAGQLIRSMATSSAFQQPAAIAGLIKNVHKNISLRSCVMPTSTRRGAAAAVASVPRDDERNSQLFVSGNSGQRPLAVLLTWLAAKEKIIEKYRSLWFQRGFDVLTVKMSAHHMVLPKYGAVPLVQDLVRFLSSVVKVYPDLILHLFSVGGYQFGEMLYQLNNPDFLKTIRKENESDDDAKSAIEKAIKGVICDSVVDIDGAPTGVSKAFSDNPSIQLAFEKVLRAQLKMAHPIVTQYLERGRDYGLASNLKHAPGLVMASDIDQVGTLTMAEKITQRWRDQGIDVTLRPFEGSGHVQHFAKHPQIYLEEIDTFLKKVTLDSRPQ